MENSNIIKRRKEWETIKPIGKAMPDFWKCSHCYFDNPLHFEICQLCRRQRSTTPTG